MGGFILLPGFSNFPDFPQTQLVELEKLKRIIADRPLREKD